jgi:hypothetical protein
MTVLLQPMRHREDPSITGVFLVWGFAFLLIVALLLPNFLRSVSKLLILNDPERT